MKGKEGHYGRKNRAFTGRMENYESALGEENRTIMEMVEDFVGVTDWDKHTLIVMLKRMEAKGVVAYETIGRTKHYYPVGKQADFVQQETKSFLDRVYRGSFGEMLTTMVKQEQLSEQDLKQLRQLLEDTEEKG